jgi:hypothetical protein
VDVTAAELAVVGVAAPEVVIALAAQSAVGEYPGVCQLVHAPGARDDPCGGTRSGGVRRRRANVKPIRPSALHFTAGEIALLPLEHVALGHHQLV